MVEKFSLDGVEQTQQEILTYVQNAMKKCNMTSSEIEEYVKEAKKYDFPYLLETSQSYLDMCNQYQDPALQPEVKVTYLW